MGDLRILCEKHDFKYGPIGERPYCTIDGLENVIAEGLDKLEDRKDIARQLIQFTKNKDNSYTVWLLHKGWRLLGPSKHGVTCVDAIPLGHCRDEESYNALVNFFQAHNHDITVQEFPMGEAP